MKKLLLLFTLIAAVSCQYDDQWIKDEFIQFDKNLTILQNQPNFAKGSSEAAPEEFRPLGAPVLIECEWRGDVLVRIE